MNGQTSRQSVSQPSQSVRPSNYGVPARADRLFATDRQTNTRTGGQAKTRPRPRLSAAPAGPATNLPTVTHTHILIITTYIKTHYHDIHTFFYHNHILRTAVI
ncbi:hypothetical protein ElyMa_004089600 [Elysia marginata]|uniref:Uncharacterized protein n=1 Tax=Elysia marginata TaxID=1093978 RepID=A0AAV4GAF1_9GAST|nr:hypothetical protein ElyMa_004089600 [Elysia marginata]